MALRQQNRMDVQPRSLSSLLSEMPTGWVLTIALFAFLFMATSLQGQTVAGTVTGTITDPSGAIVPGAIVTVKNTNTGGVRNSVTNGTGYFSIPALPPGPYMLDVKLKGFQEETSSLTVSVGQTLNISLKLRLGSDTEKVDVFSTGSLGLQTESH